MKTSQLLPSVCLFLWSVCAPSWSIPVECHRQMLAEKFSRMIQDDQKLRGRYITILEKEHSGGTFDPAEKAHLEMSITEIDERNRTDLDHIINICGWPGISHGKRATHAAFMIVQHAPLPYQLKYFPLIERANLRGEITNEHFAWLVDRILIRQGKPQKYGTEFEYGSNRIFPVDDAANLNKRRKKIGLAPLKGFPK